MKKIILGDSDLNVSTICLGTMTFGEQVNEADSMAIMDRALALGINFFDTAEMYSVPVRAETFGMSETIIGAWLKRRNNREQVILASKVAGPSRGMPWVRENPRLIAQDIIASCEGSLKRLQTEVIDLYQIHWPERQVPVFGSMYFDPQADTPASTLHEQLEALGRLVKDGKVRYIGLSNESAYGVHEFVHLAEKHQLPKIISIQNAYSLTNRSFENGLDESCFRLNVGLLAYSPLAFGVLTGKYDQSGLSGATMPAGARLTVYEAMRQQRWGRKEALAAAKLYNNLARAQGLTPTQMALAFCLQKWQVASTIIGVTSLAQLEENVAATAITLNAETLAEINAIRWQYRDPAI